MSWYVFNPHLSYNDWLRLSAAERMIDKAARQNAEKIASGARHLNKNMECIIEKSGQSIRNEIELLNNSVTSSLDRISGQLDSISMSIDNFHADFNWWAEKQSRQLSTIQDILERIQESLERRHRTEAFELFSESREYVFHRMYEKALRNIEIAIHGSDKIRGYELEWRFWKHLGFLRLGDEQNNSRDIVNLKKAQEAFLMSASLAEREGSNNGAVRCLLAASQAAYCNGDIASATSHVHQALRLQPMLPEANWLCGRLYWEKKNDESAEQSFFKSLQHDHLYSHRFWNDPIFPKSQDRLNRICNNLTARLRKHRDVQKPLTTANNLLKSCRRVSDLISVKSGGRFAPAMDLANTEEEIANINDITKSAKVEDAAFMASAGSVRVNHIISECKDFLYRASSYANGRLKELSSEGSSEFAGATFAAFIFVYVACAAFIVIGLLVFEEITFFNLILLPFGVALAPLVMIFISGSAFNDPSAPENARMLIMFFWAFVVLGSFVTWHFVRRRAPHRGTEKRKLHEAVRIADRAAT